MDNSFVKVSVEDESGAVTIVSHEYGSDVSWHVLMRLFVDVLRGKGYAITEGALNQPIGEIVEQGF